MTFRNLFPQFILLSLLMGMSACTSVGDLKSIAEMAKPKVKVAKTEITGFSMEDVDLAFTVDVDNPNPVAISLAGFDYEILINDKSFTQGSQNTLSSVAAATVSQINVPVKINFADLKGILKDFSNDKAFNYQVKTVAKVNVPYLGAFPLESTSTGDLPIPKVPKISVSGIELGKLNFTSADFLVKLNIDNPNIFDILISSLAYNISVGGKNWIQSSTNKPLSLKQDSNNELVIPVSLSLLELGSGLLSTLKSKDNVDYRINGDLNFDTSLPMLKNINLPFDYSAKTKSI